MLENINSQSQVSNDSMFLNDESYQCLKQELLDVKELLSTGHIEIALSNLLNMHSESPQNIDIISTIASIYTEKGDYDKSIEFLEKALELSPRRTDILFDLAMLFYNAGKYSWSMNVINRTLLIEDDYIPALELQAVIYLNCIGDLAKAETINTEILNFDNENTTALMNRGIARVQQGKHEQALEDFVKAQDLGLHSLTFFKNFGYLLDELNQKELALKYYEYAINLPGNVKDKIEVAWNGACIAMSLGLFQHAWELYQLRKLVTLNWEKGYPVWKGSDLTDKTLLLRREQGLSDEIRFLSVLSSAVSEAKHVILEVDERLVSLIQRSFPSVTVVPSVTGINGVSDDYGKVDFAAHVGDLACYRRPNLESFPIQNGYLTPDLDRVNYWDNYFSKYDGLLKIGIAWRTGDLKGGRAFTHPSLLKWYPIFQLANIQFVNIFYGDAVDELAYVKKTIGVDIHTPIGIDLKDDQDDLAALLSSLDLVIGVSTAPVELAMALPDLPVWKLPFVSKETLLQWHFGQYYIPWAPLVKPVYAETKEGTIDVVVRELSYVLGAKDPKQALLDMHMMPETCFME